MTRQDADNLMSMRQMRDRSPVEKALNALRCLTPQQQCALSDMYRQHYEKMGPRCAGMTLTFTNSVPLSPTEGRAT